MTANEWTLVLVHETVQWRDDTHDKKFRQPDYKLPPPAAGWQPPDKLRIANMSEFLREAPEGLSTSTLTGQSLAEKWMEGTASLNSAADDVEDGRGGRRRREEEPFVTATTSLCS
jgi:hypothetical protein